MPVISRLHSLILRGGFSRGSSSAILSLLSKSTLIRHVCFMHADFGSSPEDTQLILTVFLRKRFPIRRVDFINCKNLDTMEIPISRSRDGFQLVIERSKFHSQNPPHNPRHRFQFQLPPNNILSNLTSLVFHVEGDALPGDWGFPPGPQLELGLPGLCDVVSAATNLRVFSLTAPITSASGQWGWGNPSHPDIPDPLAQALASRSKLVSLGLTALVMKREQLQLLCESLPQLLHFCVFMDGEAVEISTYSQHFSKLSHLIALDVALAPRDPKCPCGHELDPRVPHQEEGSAMGRLCRRFRTLTELAVVRLSQNGWPPGHKACIRDSWELRWIGSPDTAMKKLERICGPCETDAEAACNIFLPKYWFDIP